MGIVVRRLLVVVGMVTALAGLVALPAAAGIEGPCTASFNGIDVDQIDSPGSALEVDIDDAIAVTGTAPSGTSFVEISLRFGLFAVGVADVDVDDEGSYADTVEVGDFATFGVGLYEVLGETDDCTGSAYVKITGKSPFTTVAGIAGTALTFIGLGIAGASWIPAFGTGGGGWLLASGGGFLFGLGIAVLLQQFGILPLSTPVLIAAIIGGPAIAAGVTALGKAVGGGGGAATAT